MFRRIISVPEGGGACLFDHFRLIKFLISENNYLSLSLKVSFARSAPLKDMIPLMDSLTETYWTEKEGQQGPPFFIHDYHDPLTFAESDLKANWEIYRERFLREYFGGGQVRESHAQKSNECLPGCKTTKSHDHQLKIQHHSFGGAHVCLHKLETNNSHNDDFLHFH